MAPAYLFLPGGPCSTSIEMMILLVSNKTTVHTRSDNAQALHCETPMRTSDAARTRCGSDLGASSF